MNIMFSLFGYKYFFPFKQHTKINFHFKRLAMSISKLKIKNFKYFSDWFTVDFDQSTNILVGNNGTGKSTVLEAVNLVLTGTYRGKNIKNELSHNLFNKKAVDIYLDKIKSGKYTEPPEIVIEVYFHDEIPSFSGDGNSENQKDKSGTRLSICFDNEYANEYKLLFNNGITSIPIEYYKIEWMSFARENITSRRIPIKSAIIDTTSSTSISGSDIYISRIVKNILDENDIINISQAYRMMKEKFSQDKSIAFINDKLTKSSNNNLSIAVDFGTKNSWESSLVTHLNNIPYNNIGKGEQSIIKTCLAISDKKAENRQILLIEEPESHLSHSNLNLLLNIINDCKNNRQIIITTHSSFVSNKLGLSNLILLNDSKTLKLNDLSSSTSDFFKKISGYDTLRLLLSKKAILVEGDSDELVIQRAYMDSFNNHLPIQDGVDVISVGTSFLRFLEIAKILNLKVSVVTDNDGNIIKLKNKYKLYLEENKTDNIKICFDENEHEYDGNLKNYNYNTLEPCIFRENSLETMNKVLDMDFSNSDELLEYMRENKTKVSLKIFNSETKINYPKYIKEAIKHEW